ncbi:AbrB/MazE/SpoVT family DNA-binding domain-containing protein [Neolewinella sp.]|uniref:AbrB/MazE/SpoVT family DNA-binding domain-containing protein n=1 Tax=Neolewinella sp. TaxID=2993543 RepID=UPI003B52DC5F
MEAKIVKIGNSKGVRIPKKVLQEYAIEDTIEMNLLKEGILIKPARKVREGWDEAFAKMAAEGDDELLINDVFVDETFDF